MINTKYLQIIREFDGFEFAKEVILEHNINKAKKSIQSYLNYKDDEFEVEQTQFSTQIVDLAMYYYSQKDHAGITQMSQGSRSVSYAKSGIPTEIKDSLPLPRVRVIG